MLEDSYAEQVRGLLDGGVDVLLIETCQDILQCQGRHRRRGDGLRRGAAARVPIMVQVTMETTGTMLVGTDIAAAAGRARGLPADRRHRPELRHRPAGDERARPLPQPALHAARSASCPTPACRRSSTASRTTRSRPTSWPAGCVEFVEEDGVNIVGGCCGTTPEHIARRGRGRRTAARPSPAQPAPSSRSVVQPLPGRRPSARTTASSSSASGPTPTAPSKFRELLEAEDWDGMVSHGQGAGQRAAATCIDVCVDLRRPRRAAAT